MSKLDIGITVHKRTLLKGRPSKTREIQIVKSLHLALEDAIKQRAWGGLATIRKIIDPMFFSQLMEEKIAPSIKNPEQRNNALIDLFIEATQYSPKIAMAPFKGKPFRPEKEKKDSIVTFIFRRKAAAPSQGKTVTLRGHDILMEIARSKNNKNSTDVFKDETRVNAFNALTTLITYSKVKTVENCLSKEEIQRVSADLKYIKNNDPALQAK